jgi:hypothetical protein
MVAYWSLEILGLKAPIECQTLAIGTRRVGSSRLQTEVQYMTNSSKVRDPAWLEVRNVGSQQSLELSDSIKPFMTKLTST